mgnify:CR=1 FL=1
MFTIESSYYFSLFVQAITLLIFYLTISSIYYQPQFILLENAYFIEYTVSIIEFIGYIILGFYINSKFNITTIRYADWFITTGQMIHAGNLAVTQAGGSEQYYWEIFKLFINTTICPSIHQRTVWYNY